ncbi:uncharacterized protein [Pagrus major]|uniref:uncharacterized protein isoform X2 n=1 Tax=Pagrus major TaxID=143350 RepID=UPI003CC8BE9B
MNLITSSCVIYTLVLTVYSAFPGDAAATQLDLKCNVTRLPEGSFKYQLSQPRGSNRCQTEWEDQNKTAIATGSDTDQNQVLNLTDSSIVLNNCKDVLRHTRDCFESFEEARCSVNCSRLLDESQPPTVNSTLICISESLCSNQLTFWLGITAVVLLVVGVFVCLCLGIRKRPRSAIKASYDVVTGHMEV